MEHIKLASAFGRAFARAKYAYDDDEDEIRKKKKPGGGMMDYLPAALGVGAAGAGLYGAHRMGWLNGMGLDRLGIPDTKMEPKWPATAKFTDENPPSSADLTQAQQRLGPLYNGVTGFDAPAELYPGNNPYPTNAKDSPLGPHGKYTGGGLTSATQVLGSGLGNVRDSVGSAMKGPANAIEPTANQPWAQKATEVTQGLGSMAEGVGRGLAAPFGGK